MITLDDLKEAIVKRWDKTKPYVEKGWKLWNADLNSAMGDIRLYKEYKFPGKKGRTRTKRIIKIFKYDKNIKNHLDDIMRLYVNYDIDGKKNEFLEKELRQYIDTDLINTEYKIE